ncbi:MAG: NAD(P)-dependent oxidoreductase [Pseudomonadota bacterium]
MSQRIAAITGATGFVGGALLRTLIDQGWRVRALARRPRAIWPNPAIEIVQGDLSDARALDTLCNGVDTVVHIAAATKARSRSHFQATNVDGPRSVAEAASRGSPEAPFLFVSSMAAREPELSDYAASKRDGEDAVAKARGTLDWTFVRPPAVYGPRDKELLSFFRLLRSGWAVSPAVGSSDPLRLSMIYIDDLADALAACVRGPVPKHQIFEVCGPDPVDLTWADIQTAASAALGVAPRQISVPQSVLLTAAAINAAFQRALGRSPMLTPGKVRELFHPDWVARNNLLQETADWRPKTGLDEGFAQTIAWYRSQNLL